VPSRRGKALLVTAAVLYAAGRLIGTWELYFASFAVVFMVGLSVAVVAASAHSLRVSVRFEPEQPSAGDNALMTAEVANYSLWCAPDVTLRVDLTEACGEAVEWSLGTMWPRRRKALERHSAPLRRGSYDLAAPELVVSDLLGLARRVTTHGEGRTLLVLPRIARLSVFTSLAGGFADPSGGLRGRLSGSASEFRGVRPHQPGEPLSRIDWKSTAKTGVLMLKETGDPGRARTVVAVDGSRYAVSGLRPADSFEATVSVAGSIADLLLRQGMPVELLLHGAVPKEVVFEGEEGERHRLLELLALARSDADRSLGESLDRGLARPAGSAGAVIISSAFDRGLLLALGSLAGRKVPLLVVHVSPSSFGGRPSDVGEKRFLLGLAQAGIPALTVRAGDCLEEVLGEGLRPRGGGRGPGSGRERGVRAEVAGMPSSPAGSLASAAGDLP